MFLKDHPRTHTREKPFRCVDCGMAFSPKSHLLVQPRKYIREKTYHVCFKFKYIVDGMLFKLKRLGDKPYICTIVVIVSPSEVILKAI